MPRIKDALKTLAEHLEMRRQEEEGDPISHEQIRAAKFKIGSLLESLTLLERLNLWSEGDGQTKTKRDDLAGEGGLS